MSDIAKKAAHSIYKDCLDRRGIKWEFEKVDPGVMNESIIPAWTMIIDVAIQQRIAAIGVKLSAAEKALEEARNKLLKDHGERQTDPDCLHCQALEILNAALAKLGGRA